MMNFCLGALFAFSIMLIGGTREAPQPLVSPESTSYTTSVMDPMTIKLRVLSPEAFDRQDPIVEDGLKSQAFTNIALSPCVVNIPEGWAILSQPSTGRAEWASRAQGNALAHEILHCMRGHWHPDWPTIMRAGR